MRHSILLCTAAILARGQIVSFGVKAGVPVTEALPFHFNDNSSFIDTGRWTIGPTVEVRLIYGFSVEFDALYRGYRLGETSAFTAIISPNTSPIGLFTTYRQDTKVWDLPLLFKYRFAGVPLHPFVDAGYSFTHESSDVTYSSTCLGSTEACSVSNTNYLFVNSERFQNSHYRRGPAAGAGVEFKYGRVKIAPEVRYSRLNDPNTNQATVLVGFMF